MILPSGPGAASVARQAIAEGYPTLSPAVRDDLWLLVTELVTNAARHGAAGRDGAIELDFRRDDGLVHVRVVDPGTDFAPVGPPTNGDSSGGWGLFLVDRIAERWGVCRAPSGTCVWFEVAAGATH